MRIREFATSVLTIWLLICANMLSLFVFTPVEEVLMASADTLTVDDSGGANYFTIQDAINASKDGDTVYVYNGTYYENVIVNKSINLTGEDKDNTIINGSGNGDVINIKVDWVNITGFTITNSGSISGDAGIEAYKANNCTISDNNISFNNKDGIYLQVTSYNYVRNNDICFNYEHGIRSMWSPESYIINNNIISNGEFGFQSSSSGNTKIEDNNISNNKYGVQISGSPYNTIINNTISSNDKSGVVTGSSPHCIIRNNTIVFNSDRGVLIGQSFNNTVDSNFISSTQGNGIYLATSSNNTINNNIISLNQGMGIYLTTSSNNTITNNSMTNDGVFIYGTHLSHFDSHSIPTNNTVNDIPLNYFKDMNGIYFNGEPVGQLIFVNCTDIEINNTELNNADVGIEIAYSSNATFSNNNLSDNCYGLYMIESTNINLTNNKVWNNFIGGIYIDFSSNNTFSNNDLYNNGYGVALWGGGFYFGESSNNTIANNVVSSSKMFGIFCRDSSHNNTIIGNNVSNSDYGIYISKSSGNEIIGSTIFNNPYGIHLYDTNNNTFHHNNIMNNAKQVYFDPSTCFDNVWNDTNGEGNYWSDYNGVDDGSGGRFAGDGIGDTEIPHPFVDQGDGYYQLDNYPLINPVGNFIFLNEGWNLISIPNIQPDRRLRKVLASIEGKYDAVRWFNVSDISDPWKHNHTSKPPFMNDLDSLDHTMGTWIHITEPNGALFEYSGIRPTTSQEISLVKGWNLVGYPSSTVYNRTLGLNNTDFGTHVNSIWSYDAATQKWENMQESDAFRPGRGYWIHAKMNVVWLVPI